MRFLVGAAFLGVAVPAVSQTTIEVDESTVHADFDYRECRKAAKTHDEVFECTARDMIWREKFYSDGTLRADDPNRGERKREAYLDSVRHSFVCTNRGEETVRIEAIYTRRNELTGAYVITTEDMGEVTYTPVAGDLCRTAATQ